LRTIRASGASTSPPPFRNDAAYDRAAGCPAGSSGGTRPAVGSPTGRWPVAGYGRRTHPGRRRGKDGSGRPRTSAPVEQVGRRRPGRRRLGREPEVRENLPDHDGSSMVATTRIRPPHRGQANTSIANVLHQLRPRPLSCRRRRGLLHAHGGRWISTRRRHRRRWLAVASSDHQARAASRRAARLQPAGGPQHARREHTTRRATRPRRIHSRCPPRGVATAGSSASSAATRGRRRRLAQRYFAETIGL
jgi:hypothetical protein